MKRSIVVFVFIAICSYLSAQNKTEFKQTNQQFKNGEFVWDVVYNGNVIGEFWPVHGINLVTNQTDPNLFTTNASLDVINKQLGGVATAPDGMSKGSSAGYVLEGKCLANGVPCGDDIAHNYGIVMVEKGFNIYFNHASAINTDSLYQECLTKKSTLFFLPSIYRNGKFLSNSSGRLDKVLIRRETKLSNNNWKVENQIGVILFNETISYQDIKNIVLGLDRNLSYAKSTTTHIYALDGGPSWGQSCKEVNGQQQLMGTRDPSVVTNYLVFY